LHGALIPFIIATQAKKPDGKKIKVPVPQSAPEPKSAPNC
jgi:hypothetical protein